MNLMEEADLPAIYVKKELKRNSDVPDLEKKIRKEDGFNSQGGTYAPRYIFKIFSKIHFTKISIFAEFTF